MIEIFTNWNLILIALLIVILYYYGTRNHNYWKSKGISGPKPLPFLGNILEIFYKPLSEIEEERFQKYGRIHGFYDFNKPIITVGEPELIKQILVKDFNNFINRRRLKVKSTFVNKFLIVIRDDDWKRVRAITSPTFSSGKLRKMFDSIDDCVEAVLKKLDQFGENRDEVDLKWLFGSYTMNVIARCAFATDTNALEDKNNAFVKFASKVINVPLWRQIFFILTPGFILDIMEFTIAPPNSFQFFRDVAKHVLNDRKTNKNPNKYNDFLQLLVDAEKPNDFNLEEISESQDEIMANAKAFKLSSNENKKLDEDEIISNIVIFMVAGYETTASLLSFSAYELALNPESQEKLYEEIKRCEEINYDSISKLSYLEAVVCETLRLHNPVTRVEREAIEEYELGETGIKLKPDSIVAIPIHAIHHDPEYFPNPNQFRPERFYGEEKKNIIPYTYIPFGGGPRNCIGMRFALIEAKLALAKIILKYKFYKTANTQIPLKYSNTRPGILQAINITVGVDRR